MPTQINTGTVGQRLVRLFGLKGRFQPILDEVIVPVVEVGEPEVESRLAAGWGTGTAVAAQTSFVRLSNPAGSRVVLELVACRVASTTGVNFAAPGIPIVPGTVGSSTTLNWLGGSEEVERPGAPIGTIEQGQHNAVIFSNWFSFTGTTARDNVELPVAGTLIPPGSEAICFAAAVNQQLWAAWVWRERYIDITNP